MTSSEIARLKQQVRRLAQRRRAALDDRSVLSWDIHKNLADVAGYAAAQTILFYISVRNEVDTRDLLDKALAAGRQVVVPYCENGELHLVRLLGRGDLEIGAHNIPEPSLALRGDPARQVAPEQVDLAVIPGVAFDTLGYRLGHGAGYYDKLLARMRPDAARVGLAFECQIVDELPIEPHDMPMDYVVTESTIYVRRRRRSAKPRFAP